MSPGVREQVLQLAEPIVRDEAMELVDVEYRREGQGWVLRLIIDKEGGVTLDDCSRISREVSRALDVADLIPYAYHLVVSSPGLDRPLRREQDFQRFHGRRVKIWTLAPLPEAEGRRTFDGTLLGLGAAGVVVEDPGGRRYQIPLEQIAKAHLVYE
ncbi:MAG: ribosome maturation factor RimP [Deltaproteobacteria bacterium]|nr:ribosome maturation factor RimP [Deltaproteobacteria bacterium]